jgi:hypothetical protein
MRHQGKLVILFIFGVGLTAAIGSMWFHFQQSRHTLALWGAGSARLISEATQIDLLAFGPPAPGTNGTEETVEVDGQALPVSQRRNGAGARGMLNVRHSLVQDMTFAWPPSEPACDGPWQFGMRFTEGSDSTLVLFDLAGGCVRAADSKQGAKLVDEATADFRSFFDEQFGAASPNAN